MQVAANCSDRWLDGEASKVGKWPQPKAFGWEFFKQASQQKEMHLERSPVRWQKTVKGPSRAMAV